MHIKKSTEAAALPSGWQIVILPKLPDSSCQPPVVGLAK
jgi:hypothetical protein